MFQELKSTKERERLHGDEAGFVHYDVRHMPITCELYNPAKKEVLIKRKNNASKKKRIKAFVFTSSG